MFDKFSVKFQPIKIFTGCIQNESLLVLSCEKKMAQGAVFTKQLQQIL